MTDQAFRPPGERPPDRYGDRSSDPRRRKVLAVAVGGLALIVVAWWVWVAAVQSNPPVRHDVLGFRAVTATSVEIRFSVVRDPGVAVACVLRARGAAGEEVGRRQVLVPADERDRIDVTHTVRTTGPAVTGEVLTCQPYEAPAGSSNPSDGEPPHASVAKLLP